MTATKARDIIEKLKKNKTTDGVRVTFFLSKKTYQDFKKLCGEVSVSAVIEAWMKEAVEEKR